MDIRTLCFCFILAFSLLLRPVTASEEEEVFDPEPWEAAETLSSVEDVASRVGAAVLMERETGTCLFEHRAHERLSPASVTKIMTMLLVCEALDGGDAEFSQAPQPPGHIGPQPVLKEMAVQALEHQLAGLQQDHIVHKTAPFPVFILIPIRNQ